MSFKLFIYLFFFTNKLFWFSCCIEVFFFFFLLHLLFIRSIADVTSCFLMSVVECLLKVSVFLLGGSCES